MCCVDSAFAIQGCESRMFLVFQSLKSSISDLGFFTWCMARVRAESPWYPCAGIALVAIVITLTRVCGSACVLSLGVVCLMAATGTFRFNGCDSGVLSLNDVIMQRPLVQQYSFRWYWGLASGNRAQAALMVDRLKLWFPDARLRGEYCRSAHSVGFWVVTTAFSRDSPFRSVGEFVGKVCECSVWC